MVLQFVTIFKYLEVSAFLLLSRSFWHTKFKEKNREEFPYLSYSHYKESYQLLEVFVIVETHLCF